MFLWPHGCSLASQLLWLCLCQVLSPSSSSHCQFLSFRNQPKCHQVSPDTLCLINSKISVFSYQPETWQKAWDTVGAQDLIEGPQLHACPLSKEMIAWTHVCQRSIHISVSRLKCSVIGKVLSQCTKGSAGSCQALKTLSDAVFSKPLTL